MKQNRMQKVGALKYPLSFFGLTILVMEAVFGVALNNNLHSELLVVYIATLMFFLLLAAILAVFVLTYIVPENLMLESGGRNDATRRQMDQLNEVVKGLIDILKYIEISDKKQAGQLRKVFDDIKHVYKISGENR